MQSVVTDSRSLIASSPRRGWRGITGQDKRELVGVKEMLGIFTVVMIIVIYKFGKTHPTIYGKQVHFILRRLVIPQLS